MDRNTLRESIRLFLQEDIGRGDITSESIFSSEDVSFARLVARQTLVVAGAEGVAAEVFNVQNQGIEVKSCVRDGSVVDPGSTIMTLNGAVIDMLKAERVALNLLQRLCGIATLTKKFVEKVKDYPVRITDTRKTTPGLRILEKYAVQVGGGYNHRFNLTDGVLIKDNHIAACRSIRDAVFRVKEKVPHTIRIEVETDNMQQVKECLDCGVDIIMLDNMSPASMKQAVKLIGGQTLVEASGGINMDTIEDIAKTGVDIISIGALTHSAPACDIGMDWGEFTQE